MTGDSSKKDTEKLHGELLQNDADKIWGRVTVAGKIRVKRRIDEFLRYIFLRRDYR